MPQVRQVIPLPSVQQDQRLAAVAAAVGRVLLTRRQVEVAAVEPRREVRAQQARQVKALADLTLSRVLTLLAVVEGIARRRVPQVRPQAVLVARVRLGLVEPLQAVGAAGAIPQEVWAV